MLHSHLCVKPTPGANPENMVELGNIRLTVLKDRLFRIEIGKNRHFEDRATQVVWHRDFPKVPFSCRADGKRYLVTTEALELVLDTEDINQSFVRFPNGSGAGLLNKGNLLGTYRTLDTTGNHLRTDPSVTKYDRAHIPLGMGVASRDGVAVYDDAQSLILLPDGTLLPREHENGYADLYVFAYGHDYPAALRALYALCGSAPVIPRFALGNWWSRYRPYTQREYTDLMDDFAEDKIPISVAVLDMDWHYVDIDGTFGITEKGLSDPAHGGTDGWTGYTWNERLFPDHAGLLADLHARGMKIALNVHPAEGIRWFEKNYSKMAERMGMDPAKRLRIPFDIANETFVNNYLDVIHHPLEDEGVDFWWIDWQQGTATALPGLDPLWALNHYHFLDHQARTGEGLILSRYCGIGAHRYPVGFSGDTEMTWEFLDYMPYFTATATNAGYTWWSHDIGGHHRGERDEELYLRWLEFGVFSPINRLHCCPLQVASKAPWTLSEPARAVAEKWLRFRHRLIPYLYTYAVLTAAKAEPLITPLYYRWPEEKEAYRAYNQYLFGERLLAAPITAKSKECGLSEADVWLPEGAWTDLFTNVRYAGGGTVRMVRDAGTIPVLAQAGCILPLDAQPTNACALPGELDVLIYSGNGSFALYERCNEADIATDFAVSDPGNGALTFTVGVPAAHTFAERTFHLYFKNIQNGRITASVDGNPCEVRTKHNRCLQALFRLTPGQRAAITVSYETQVPLALVRKELQDIMIQLPGDNLEKESRWKETRAYTKRAQFEEWIHALAVPDVYKRMMKERLTVLG